MRYTKTNDIKTCVANAIKGYQKGRNGVQNAAVNILIHAYQHGDYSQAEVLCEGVGSKTLVKWFEDFGGLIQGENGGFTGWKGKSHIEKSLTPVKGAKQGAAQSTMYWEYKAEKIWGGFDDLKAARALIAKHNAAVKVVEENPEAASKVSFHPELIAALENAIEMIEEVA